MGFFGVPGIIRAVQHDLDKAAREDRAKAWEHEEIPGKPIGYFFTYDSADKLAYRVPFRTEKAFSDLCPRLATDLQALWNSQPAGRLTAGWLWLPEPTYLRPETCERFQNARGTRISSPLLLMVREDSGGISVRLRDPREDRFCIQPDANDDGPHGAAEFLVEDLFTRFKGLPDSNPFSNHEGKKRYKP